MRTLTICTILLVIGVLLLRASTDGVLGETVEEIEWLESYEAALDEARTHNPPRWVVLILRDDTRWSQELLRRLDHAKEAIHLARTHFVMAQVTEEALPPAARLHFNELAPYAPSAFFIGPDGHVRRDLINKFAPADQDPVYKYFYKTAAPLVRMMKLVIDQEHTSTPTTTGREEL